MATSRNNNSSDMPVIRSLADFDVASGNLLERLVFNQRAWLLLLCMLVTAFFAVQLPKLMVSANFEKTLPSSHPYIVNYQTHKDDLRGLGDSVRVVVENPDGDIFDPAFLNVFAQINDEIQLLPGVDRAWQKSIWTPVVRWTESTEEGFVGGPVMPLDYDGSQRSIENLRININRAGVVGSLVSNDYRAGMIVVPLLPTDADGRKLDYHTLSEALETIRAKYASGQDGTYLPVNVHIVGFAKLVGDLINGLIKVMYFFAIAAFIASGVIFLYTRCIRSTILVLSCSLIAVVWQLGLLVTAGYALDPFSALVPFLIFAIGVSHGAQKMNGVMQDIGRGTHKQVAARYTFRRLFMAGLTALMADAVGFGVLMLIDIPSIRELAVAASMGVAVLVFTNLLLLPVLLSYTGVSANAAKRSMSGAKSTRYFSAVTRLLVRLTERRSAIATIVVASVIGMIGFTASLNLQIGDIHAGAPELRADSRYNLDDAYITSHFGVSSDIFAVMVKSAPDRCGSFENLTEIDRLAERLADVPGVQQTQSLSDTVRAYTAGGFEGNPKWFTISNDQSLVDPQITNALNWNSEFITPSCSMVPLLVYLSDHKAQTLQGVVEAVEQFAAEHDTADRQFLLAAGSAGIQAATNIVVKKANVAMLFYVYAAVSILCLIAFRSWRATIVAIVPLMMTSILAEALMVALGIGLKVATLPVIALGVGIGVDYSLYLLSAQLNFLRQGETLADAYRHALDFTGKVVALVGITLAAGVVTWVWSPIRFQADMGILLTFMFLVNMIASLILVPALSHFLLSPSRLEGGVVDDGHNVGTLLVEPAAGLSNRNQIKEASI